MKERYIVQKVLCIYPDTLCRIKDTEGTFSALVEDVEIAQSIANQLNVQNRQIEELAKQEPIPSDISLLYDFVKYCKEVKGPKCGIGTRMVEDYIAGLLEG